MAVLACPSEGQDEDIEIDSCGASSSRQPEQFTFFHVGDGQFKPVSSHSFSEILDLTPLDLSNRHERDWATTKNT